MNDSVMKLTGLNKSFINGAGNNHVLKQVDFSVYSGEMVAILGQSGSGKSTLLSIMGLLDKADSGQYFLCDHDVNTLSDYQLSLLRNKHIGWVFQNFNLIADMTVGENLSVPLRFNKSISRVDYEVRIDDVLRQVGLQDKKLFYPAELSGGQQQRVAIARALICQPDIILCDEPTGNLDSTNSDNVMELLSALNREGKTVLIITHDPAVAACCQKAYKIHDGEVASMSPMEFKHAV
ncbi:ABC transporter ATP-binding protein [Shewanella algidipiscicola]|uniref:Macrolide ABC transporter ATP-binding protein n=1 Tax=Shewanella algidipiscicola TaxID=614070 RepID=A0ABQ4PNM9_9GAMM|nr:ABC transporter ATP-binding protein [Shewanella algidipiscicola]GIU49314.1 macrolide ABC transporter ATP-binding protein [Shewanella algidipiscicola]